VAAQPSQAVRKLLAAFQRLALFPVLVILSFERCAATGILI
jgi:hypothetical protein